MGFAKPVNCKDHGLDACSMPQCAAGIFAVAVGGVQFLGSFRPLITENKPEPAYFDFASSVIIYTELLRHSKSISCTKHHDYEADHDISQFPQLYEDKKILFRRLRESFGKNAGD